MITMLPGVILIWTVYQFQKLFFAFQEKGLNFVDQKFLKNPKNTISKHSEYLFFTSN